MVFLWFETSDFFVGRKRLDVLKAADAGLELVHEGEARRCR